MKDYAAEDRKRQTTANPRGGAPLDTGQYITVKDAAVRLGVSRQRVHQYIHAGRLAAVQVGEGSHRVWLVNRDGLHLLDRQAPGRPRKA